MRCCGKLVQKLGRAVSENNSRMQPVLRLKQAAFPCPIIKVASERKELAAMSLQARSWSPRPPNEANGSLSISGFWPLFDGLSG